MTITIKDLPQSTAYAVLKEAKGRKERIKAFIDTTANNYPTTKARITQFWTENQGEYDKLKGISSMEVFAEFFNKYDGEQDLIDLVKPEVIKQIGELLTEKAGDSDIIKELKAVYKDHKDEIPDFLKDATGGVSYLIFLTDLFKDYYLTQAPKEINELLSENDIKLSELNKDKWKEAKDGLFTNIYANLSNDQEESDLDETIKELNGSIGNIKDLIIKTRKTRDSNLQDDLDEAKREKTKAEEDLKKEKEEKKEIVKHAGEATAKITQLENENKQLKKDLEAEKKKPAPTPGGGGAGGTTTAEPEEWLAVCKFLTEPDYNKAEKLFNDLYNKPWTPAQKNTIYKMLVANKDNAHWARNKWTQHFNN